MAANCNEINLQKLIETRFPSRRGTPQLNKHEWTADSSKREWAWLGTEPKAFDIDWQKAWPIKKSSYYTNQLDIVLQVEAGLQAESYFVQIQLSHTHLSGAGRYL